MFYETVLFLFSDAGRTELKRRRKDLWKGSVSKEDQER